jgi:hypothetical protein
VKVGDLVLDRYHKKLSIIVEVWGRKETGMFVKLHNGSKVAIEYMQLVNAS